jgi:hypothetical protein
MNTWRRTLTAAAALFALAALPSTSAANDLFTLDANPISNGHLIEDGAGNAYVAWTSEGVGTGVEPVKYCKIAPGGTCSPTTLPIPGATSISDSASSAFPVFGPGNTLYVVAPRYPSGDVIIFTSLDGGGSWGATEVNAWSNKTDATDVFRIGSTFMIGSYNPGLGFSTADTGGGGEAFGFTNPGSVAGSSMGLADGANPVIAYWNIDSPPYPLLFRRYDGSGSPALESNWVGAVEVTKGYEPDLSTGAAGLFMVSQDYSGGSSSPNAINVRKYEGSNFGPARTLTVDPSTSLFVGGAIGQSPSGNRLAVVWPGKRGGDDASVMRLWTSTDGGNNYSESHVAFLGNGYELGPNAEVATTDGGSGWVIFTDASGLRIADLNPIAGPPPGESPLPPIYKGKTKVVTKKVGNFLIVLRLPKSCLQSRQRFFVGVGKRKRKQLSKRLGGEIRFTKVVFIYDGKKLKVKKKKPFRYLINPGPLAAGSVHRVKAKVTLVLTKGDKEKEIKRTIKGTVRAC